MLVRRFYFIILCIGLLVHPVLKAQQVTPNPIGTQILQHPMSMGTTVRKMQTIYLPTDFVGNTQSGFITHLYVRGLGLSILNLTVNDLVIKMGQTSSHTFASNQFFDSLQAVLLPQAQRSFSPANVIGSYVLIPLDLPFQYNHTLPLVVEISSTGANNTFNATSSSKTGRRLFSNQLTATTGTLDNLQLNLGFDVLVPTGPNVALLNLLSPQENRLGAGKYPIRIQIRNLSADTLRQLNVDWRFGSQAATAIWTGTVLPGQSFEYQFADSITLQQRSSDSLRVWTSMPNGQMDTSPGNDSVFHILRTRLAAGTYSVGYPNSDFVQLQDAINFIEQAGIDGNVVLEIENGIYNAGISLSANAMLDTLRQLHIRSKAGVADSVIIISAAGPVVGANNANFVQLSNLTLRRAGIQASGSTGVINLLNCRQWHIRGCKSEVVSNPYNEPFDSQGNIFTNDVRDLSMVQCDITGGAYAFSFNGNTSGSAQNIRIDSSRITAQVGGIYSLSRVTNFTFRNNVVIKSSQRGSGFDQMVHFFSPGFTITNNQLNVVTNGHCMRITSSPRASNNLPNLFANNVVRLHLQQPSSLLFVGVSTSNNLPNSIQFEHNNVLLTNDSLPGTTPWGVIHFNAFFPTSYNNCSVVNNLFQWKPLGPIAAGRFFMVATESLPNSIQVNHNLYSLPEQNTYVQLNPQGPTGMGAFSNWDAQSFTMPFELDSVQGYRINQPLNSRWSNTSSAVSTDITGRQRQLPASDLGAYEAVNITRPLFLARALSDTVATSQRTAIVQYLPAQAGDTAEIRLFYKGVNQTQWASVPSLFIGNNRYRLNLVYGLLDSTLVGPARIEYYYAYRLPGGNWLTYPEGGSISVPPAQPLSFVASNILGSTIRVGSLGEISNLYDAMTALSQNTIRRSVTLLLTDSVYDISAAGLQLLNYTMVDTSLSITIRPDLGKHVIIRDQTANKWMFQVQTAGHLRIIGRDIQGNGSLTWEQNGSAGSGAISLQNFMQNPNIFISQVRFVALHPSNTLVGIQATSYTQQLIISGCEFLNYSIAIRFTNIRNGWIDGNTFGDSTITTTAVNELVSLNQTWDVVIQRNTFRNVTFLNSRFNFSMITVRNAVRKTQVLNNVFSNIGYEALFSDANRTTVRRASIVRLESTFDSLIMVGNLIEKLRLPVNRTDSTGASVKEWYLIQTLNLNSVQREWVQFLHNTVLVSGSYFGNCSNRFYGFAMQPMKELIIQNNVFGFDLKGNPQRFKGGLFLYTNRTNQIFDSTTIGHNLYLLDSARTFPYYWEQDTIAIRGLNNWRNKMAIPGRQQERVSFELAGNLDVLVPSAAMPGARAASHVKSNAIPLTLPGIATLDLNNVLRSPADIGAYQVQSSFSVDALPPVISQVQFDTSAFACLGQTRQFSVQVADTGSGVSRVELSLWNGLAALRIPLALSSGNQQLGTWTAMVPVDTNLRYAMASLIASDSAGNVQYSNQWAYYHNYALIASISANSVVSTQHGIRAKAHIPGIITIAISEFGYQRAATGFTTVFPPHANSQNNAYLELTNYGSDTLDLSGYRLRIQANDTMLFPTPYLVPPGAVILITEGATNSAQVNNHYFTYANMTSNLFGENNGIMLITPDRSRVVDAIYFQRFFNSVVNIVPGTWTGNPIPFTFSVGGFKLDGLDMNCVTNWRAIGVNNPGNLGFNNLSSNRKPSIHYQWGGILQGNGREASRPPMAGGTYQISLQANSGVCASSDTFTIRISGNDSTDVVRPILSELQLAPNFNDLDCANGQRWLSVRAQDTAAGSGVLEVLLFIESSNGLVQRVMQRASGNNLDGIYSLNLANERSSGLLRVLARDFNNNVSDTIRLPFFHGRRLNVIASNDTFINAGDSVLLRARSTGRDRSAIQLTEVLHLPGGSGFQPVASLPAGLNITNASIADVYEITNTGRDSLMTHGIVIRLFSGSQNWNIPLPSIIMPPLSQIFIVVSNTPAPNIGNVFYVSPFIFDLQSGGFNGITLLDTVASQRYLTAVATNGFLFPANLNIPASVWSGAGIANVSQTASIYRVNTNPNNTGWTTSNQSLGRLTNLGSSIPFPQQYDTIQWFGPTGFLGSGDSIRVRPTMNTLFRAQAGNGTCVATDSIFVAVVGGNQQTDMQVLSISQPAANQTNPFTVNPQVRLVNRGNTPISRIPLRFSVNGSLLHQDTAQAVIMPGDTMNFTSSRSWQVPLGGVHQFCARAVLVGDSQPGNDSICIQTFGRDARQFARFTEFVSPAAGINIRDSVQVRVRILNVGTDTLQSVRLSFADSASVTFEQLFNVALLPGQQQILTFNRFYIPSDSSSNRLCVRLLGNWPDSVCQQLGGISTSVRPFEKLSSDVQVYPNPTANKVFVEVSEKSILREVELYDAHGKLLQQIIPDDPFRTDIDVKPLHSGLYLLRIYTVDGVHTRRIVVQH
ncbi:MAG: hypothetical protein C0424_05930 [Sphingobacteriaceae bacterium]|nr:hypothetical protein [Sphingobacteriaceae bacterium]